MPAIDPPTGIAPVLHFQGAIIQRLAHIGKTDNARTNRVNKPPGRDTRMRRHGGEKRHKASASVKFLVLFAR